MFLLHFRFLCVCLSNFSELPEGVMIYALRNNFSLNKYLPFAILRPIPPDSRMLLILLSMAPMSCCLLLILQVHPVLFLLHFLASYHCQLSPTLLFHLLLLLPFVFHSTSAPNASNIALIGTNVLSFSVIGYISKFNCSLFIYTVI